MKKEPVPENALITRPGRLSAEQWGKGLGENKWSAGAPEMKKAFELCGNPEGKRLLARAFRGHLNSIESSKGNWSGNLGARARLDCLRALFLEPWTPEAAGVAEELVAAVGASALGKARCWDSVGSKKSLAIDLYERLGVVLVKTPEAAEALLAGVKPWADQLAAWGVAQNPDEAAQSPIRGALSLRIPLEPIARAAALEASLRAFEWAKRAPQAPDSERESFAAEQGRGLADTMLELIRRTDSDAEPDQAWLLSERQAEATREAWIRAAGAGLFEKAKSPGLIFRLLRQPCPEDKPHLALDLCELGLELGAIPQEAWRSVVERPFEGLRQSLRDCQSGASLWIKKLCDDGMDPNACDKDGFSLLWQFNQLLKTRLPAPRSQEAERAAATLLRFGADPALVIQRLDPAQEAAEGAMRGMIEAALERKALAEGVPSLEGGRKRAPGI